jgi:osmotically-inducible protein OsmY
MKKPWLASILISIASAVPIARGAEPDNPYNDPPPVRATSGIAACPAPRVRVLTPEQARREAHQRIERGTSCWLAGQCEPGGDYKDDGPTTKRVAEAIAHDARFADTSLWVETLRKFVTIKGCLARASQADDVAALARSVDGVKLVWQEATSPR